MYAACLHEPARGSGYQFQKSLHQVSGVLCTKPSGRPNVGPRWPQCRGVASSRSGISAEEHGAASVQKLSVIPLKLWESQCSQLLKKSHWRLNLGEQQLAQALEGVDPVGPGELLDRLSTNPTENTVPVLPFCHACSVRRCLRSTQRGSGGLQHFDFARKNGQGFSEVSSVGPGVKGPGGCIGGSAARPISGYSIRWCVVAQEEDLRHGAGGYAGELGMVLVPDVSAPNQLALAALCAARPAFSREAARGRSYWRPRRRR